MSIPALLGALETHAVAGSHTYQLIQNVLSAKLAEEVHDGLVANATMIGQATSEFGPKLDRLNMELGETKAKIETAGKKVSDVVDARAKDVGAELQNLSAALGRATDKFEEASEHSSRLGRRLNWLTAALVFAAIVTAGATAFQAVETKRQADLIERQLQAAPVSTPGPNRTDQPKQ
jgi:hypothetical protein